MNSLQWVADSTGRFAKRPHYSPEQLDAECERIVKEFLQQKHGSVTFPISTDDLMILLENSVADLDPYADFSSEEGEIEGVTEFCMGRKPTVRISARLTSTPNLENRLRTTLTHEYGHVHFHSVLYQIESKPRSLFEAFDDVPATGLQAHRCKRDSMVSMSNRDWMEWQAGYVCGAMLMPYPHLLGQVQDFREHNFLEHSSISEQSAIGRDLVKSIAVGFQTSHDAARIRLLQKGFLNFGNSASLF